MHILSVCLNNLPLNIDFRQILLHLLNLVILFLILYFLLYSPVRNFMDRRKKYYENMEEECKTKAAEADKKEAEYSELLKNADSEAAEKKRIAVSEAQADRERIISSAEREAAAIVDKANARADEITRRAEERAKDELSEVVAKAAEEKIARACTIDGFLSEVEDEDDR